MCERHSGMSLSHTVVGEKQRVLSHVLGFRSSDDRRFPHHTASKCFSSGVKCHQRDSGEWTRHESVLSQMEHEDTHVFFSDSRVQL